MRTTTNGGFNASDSRYGHQNELINRAARFIPHSEAIPTSSPNVGQLEDINPQVNRTNSPKGIVTDSNIAKLEEDSFEDFNFATRNGFALFELGLEQGFGGEGDMKNNPGSNQDGIEPNGEIKTRVTNDEATLENMTEESLTQEQAEKDSLPLGQKGKNGLIILSGSLLANHERLLRETANGNGDAEYQTESDTSESGENPDKDQVIRHEPKESTNLDKKNKHRMKDAQIAASYVSTPIQAYFNATDISQPIDDLKSIENKTRVDKNSRLRQLPERQPSLQGKMVARNLSPFSRLSQNQGSRYSKGSNSTIGNGSKDIGAYATSPQVTEKKFLRKKKSKKNKMPEVKDEYPDQPDIAKKYFNVLELSTLYKKGITCEFPHALFKKSVPRVLRTNSGYRIVFMYDKEWMKDKTGYFHPRFNPSPIMKNRADKLFEEIGNVCAPFNKNEFPCDYTFLVTNRNITMAITTGGIAFYFDNNTKKLDPEYLAENSAASRGVKGAIDCRLNYDQTCKTLGDINYISRHIPGSLSRDALVEFLKNREVMFRPDFTPKKLIEVSAEYEIKRDN